MINFLKLFYFSFVRIYKDDQGNVALKYKNWSSDEDWLPHSDQEPLEIFKKDLLGRQIMPSGKPGVIAPVLLEGKQDINGIMKNIEKLKKYITNEDYQWWVTFFDNPYQHLSSPESAEWYFDKLLSWNDNTLMQQNDELAHLPDPPPVSPLALAMAREREIPQVITSLVY